MIRQALAWGIVALALAGCASKVTTASSGATQGVRHQSIYVFATASDGSETTRRLIEAAAVERLGELGVKAVGSAAYLPSLAGASGEQMMGALQRSGASGVLILNLTDQGATTVYTPAEREPGTFTGTVTPMAGNMVWVDGTYRPGAQTGLRPIDVPNAEMVATIYGAASGQPEWSGSARASAQVIPTNGVLGVASELGKASPEDLVRQSARHLVDAARAAGAI